MIDVVFYILAALTLPVSAIVITHYVGWTLERDLERSQRERSKKARSAAGRA